MLALFGLGIIGNNVLYGTDEMKEEDEGGGGGGDKITCFGRHAGIGNGYRHCDPCGEWVPNAHPDYWTQSKCYL